MKGHFFFIVIFFSVRKGLSDQGSFFYFNF